MLWRGCRCYVQELLASVSNEPQDQRSHAENCLPTSKVLPVGGRVDEFRSVKTDVS